MKMRHCTKGKSCGGTCINRGTRCRATLNRSVINQVNPTVETLRRILGSGSKVKLHLESDFPSLKEEAEKQLADIRNKPVMSDADALRASSLEKILLDTWQRHTNVDRPTLLERQNALEFDFYFKPTDRFGGKYDWSKSYDSGTTTLGSGSYGSVMLSKSPPPTVVKRGEVSENEIKIIEKLGGKDISPKLVSAEVNKSGGATSHDHDIDFFEGRVAMSRVVGKAAEDFDFYLDKAGSTTVGDSYFSLRKRLHEEGVAHNDAHIANVVIDSSGKARFVDFGLSQDDPRAALSEALGVLSSRPLLPLGAVTKKVVDKDSGDFQAKSYEQFKLPDFLSKSKDEEPTTNLGKIVKNRLKVYARLREMGLTNDNIADLVNHGLNQPIESYNQGAWGKVGKNEAREIIQILYEGVS